MTNHIEELMKAAGVDKVTTRGCNEHYCNKGIDIYEAHYREYLKESPSCENCPKNQYIKIYPAFTPAKQLELIKLIVEKCQEIKIYKNKYMDSFLFQAQESWGEYEYKADVENFDSCLASLILEILKNNKLDKPEVKRILEDDNQ